MAARKRILVLQNLTLSTIEEALEELQLGRIIVVIDDPERENEGDLICAARYATPENINFMATYGKGLICMPIIIPSEIRQNFRTAMIFQSLVST